MYMFNTEGGSKMRNFAVLAAALAFGLSGVANAADGDGSGMVGFYGQVAGGFNIQQDTSSTPNSGGNTTDQSTKTGYQFAAGIGYDFNPIRAEFEIAYSRNNTDSQKHPLINGGSEVDGEGYGSSTTFMVNGLYDFHNSSRFTPYLGAGVGVARIEAHKVSAKNANFPTTSDSDWVWAVGGTAGVAADIVKSIQAVVEYKYLYTDDPEFTDSTGTTSTQSGIRGHTMRVGLRYRF